MSAGKRLMIILPLLLLTAGLRAQHNTLVKKIKVPATSLSMEEISRLVYRQAGYQFSFNAATLGAALPVPFTKKEYALGELLELIRQHTGAGYTVYKEHIIFRKAAVVKGVKTLEGVQPGVSLKDKTAAKGGQAAPEKEKIAAKREESAISDKKAQLKDKTVADKNARPAPIRGVQTRSPLKDKTAANKDEQPVVNKGEEQLKDKTAANKDGAPIAGKDARQPKDKTAVNKDARLASGKGAQPGASLKNNTVANKNAQPASAAKDKGAGNTTIPSSSLKDRTVANKGVQPAPDKNTPATPTTEDKAGNPSGSGKAGLSLQSIPVIGRSEPFLQPGLIVDGIARFIAPGNTPEAYNDDSRWLLQTGVQADDAVYFQPTVMAGLQYVYLVAGWGTNFHSSGFRYGLGGMLPLRSGWRINAQATTGKLTSPGVAIDSIRTFEARSSLHRLSLQLEQRLGRRWKVSAGPVFNYLATTYYVNGKAASFSEHGTAAQGLNDKTLYTVKPLYTISNSYERTTASNVKTWVGLQVSIFYRINF